MSREVLLVVVGGGIGVVSSLVVTIVHEVFERRRLAIERVHELQDKKREHLLTVLKDKYEPALNMLAAVLKVIETSESAEDVFEKLEVLKGSESYWFVWARLPDESAEEYLSMVIRYHQIKESEEQWQMYNALVVSATKKLNELYDQERERLFGEDNAVS